MKKTAAAPTAEHQAHAADPAARLATPAGAVIQRACACGGQAGLGGDCEACRRQKGLGLQPKLAVNRPGDRWERAADRAAAQVLEGRAIPAAQAAPAPPPVDRLASTGAEPAPSAPAGLESGLAHLAGGAPLPTGPRGFFEAGYGRDFSRVRVHHGPQAGQLARSVQALAFTRGRDIVFGEGQYAPASAAGQRLLAHELAHVVQQGAAGHAPAANVVQRSYGTAEPDEVGRWTMPTPQVTVRAPGAAEPAADAASPDMETEAGEQPPEVQRQDGGTPSAVASPTLALTPGTALTRGGNLAAAVNFTPSAGERLNVTGWEYHTPASDVVSRPTTDANFQTQWAGTMALSGELRLTYTVTPAGGAAGAPQTLAQAVTVNDRTGTQFASTVTDNAETARSGQPSPPRLFSQLGIHNANITNPGTTSSNITSGPNQAFTFVSAVTNGRYTSSPQLHPDVTNASSAFRVFHQNSSVLFKVSNANGAKTRIPVGEYSNFTQNPLSWDVPNWEQFYKRHGIFTVQATGGGNTVTLANANWGLASNARDANLQITNDAAVRTQLGIGAADSYTTSVTTNFTWEGFALMASASIPTGVRSHEFVHATHSHRANFHKMMRALDPQKVIERTVSTPSNAVTFSTKLDDLRTEILTPNHELVDEAASARQERFVAVAGQTMAGINTDPATNAFLGNVWDITGNQPMT
jgi:hypothetical protein